MGTLSRSNWNLEMLVFEERGKPEYLKKTSRGNDENQQQTQPTYDSESGNRPRATLVRGGGGGGGAVLLPLRKANACKRVMIGCDIH